MDPTYIVAWPLRYSFLTNEIECHYVPTRCSTSIACIFYKPRTSTKTTILYSHGNGADLGGVIGLCVWLAKSLRCNIFAYDYSGYGRSSGKPSEKKMYGDIEAAYNFLLDHYGCANEDVILMGQSLGSAPTVHLASKVRVRGVIIQSGFTSALNVAFSRAEHNTMCCDVFENRNKMVCIESAVLVVHGTSDEVIPWSHGAALLQACPHAVAPLWLEGAGHNDVEAYPAFITRLSKFIHQELAEANTSNVSSES